MAVIGPDGPQQGEKKRQKDTLAAGGTVKVMMPGHMICCVYHRALPSSLSRLTQLLLCRGGV